MQHFFVNFELLVSDISLYHLYYEAYIKKLYSKKSMLSSTAIVSRSPESKSG